MDESHPGRPIDYRERRRVPRLETEGRLYGYVEKIDVPVSVREIGLGGFSISTACPFIDDSFLTFRLIIEDETSVLLRARVVHCRPDPQTDGTESYVTGLQFVNEPENRRAVAEIIDQLTSVMSFEN